MRIVKQSIIRLKPNVSPAELTKFGFKAEPTSAYTWRPSENCEDYELEFYNRETEYKITCTEDGQFVISVPEQWLIASKVQCLLFDLFSAGLVEKFSYDKALFDKEQLDS